MKAPRPRAVRGEVLSPAQAARYGWRPSGDAVPIDSRDAGPIDAAPPTPTLAQLVAEGVDRLPSRGGEGVRLANGGLWWPRYPGDRPPSPTADEVAGDTRFDQMYRAPSDAAAMQPFVHLLPLK